MPISTSYYSCFVGIQENCTYVDVKIFMHDLQATDSNFTIADATTQETIKMCSIVPTGLFHLLSCAKSYLDNPTIKLLKGRNFHSPVKLLYIHT